MTTKLAILDLAGTIVDHGCLAPLIAMRRAFAEFGIELVDAELRASMGLAKLDQINALLRMPRIAEEWKESQGSEPDDEAAGKIYDAFLPLQIEVARERAELVPGFVKSAKKLRKLGCKLGVTTAYPRSVTDVILEQIATEFEPDAIVCADDVESGRPAPDMILAVMEQLDVNEPSEVVVVGDTMHDIAAALAAHLRSVAVAVTGSDMGLDLDDWKALGKDEQAARAKEVRAAQRSVGADMVIDSVVDLPGVIEKLP